jgi:hypothetical protein
MPLCAACHPEQGGIFRHTWKALDFKPKTELSNFALLGYSGAKLLSDGFSIIHPFNNAYRPCEALIEASGFRHIHKNHDGININDAALFEKEFHEFTQEEAVRITVNGKHIGYVNRGLLPTFLNWIDSNRIIDAWVEKINGTPGKPAVYIYVKISPMHFRTILDSELDDFETECRIAKINPQEFQLHEHDIVEIPLNNGLFTTNAKLTITRQGVEKTYSTGNATHWVADFSNNLREGAFN